MAALAALLAVSGSLVIQQAASAPMARAADPACGPEVAGVHQISTAEQLQAMGSGGDCSIGDSYAQVADITLPDLTGDDTANWTPIGDFNVPFSGTFDGGDFVIENLTIDDSTLTDLGLFGRTWNTAVLSNAHLRDVQITGKTNVGALVGYAQSGSTIAHSSSSGVISGSQNVGGLVGRMTANLAASSMTDSTSSAIISATSRGGGGLIGSATGGSTVTRAFATGPVSAGTYAGGLIGECCKDDTIVDSFSRGSVTVTGGGSGTMSGRTDDTFVIARVYGTGSVTPSFSDGGLLGEVNGSGPRTWTASFWDVTTTGQTVALGDGATPTGTVGATTAAMKDIATFDDSGWEISAGIVDDSAWGIDPSINDGYPFLTWSAREVAYDANGGSGTTPANDAALVWQDVTVASNSGITRSGYTFSEWNTKADGSGASYAPGDSLTLPWSDHVDDTTVTQLFAQWQAVPDPTPVPASAPLDVSGTGGDGSALVTWTSPSSSGSFPITNYQAVVAPGGQSCLVAAPVTECTITGLTNGTTYTVQVRALSGAGWGPFSASSAPFTPDAPEPPVTKTISIAGTRGEVRGRPGVVVTGTVTGFEEGAILTPWVKFPGQTRYSAGRARISVDSTGEFTWQRRTGKKIYVSVRSEDGEVRSNRVIIRSR